MLRLVFPAVLAVAAGGAAAADLWRGQTAAYFGVTYIDSSIEGELGGARADETARVARVAAVLGDALEEHGLTLVDLAPVAGALDHIRNPADCNGCDVRLAAELGARYAVVSEVQKVTNLLQSMNVVVRDAATGEVVRAMAVDLRGNTDDAWVRAMGYILKHGVFTE